LSSVAPEETALFAVLDSLGIAYERFEHPPVLTVEQAEQYWANIDAAHCKNLFLRNKKGTTEYLAVVGHTKRVDLKRLTGLLNEEKLSFGSPERLLGSLGLAPGSVSPYGLINDIDKKVRVVLDADLAASSRIAFHPNVNTATIVTTYPDFERFLQARGNRVQRFSF
jgi:Ala-tRNA(Pro) deacylase